MKYSFDREQHVHTLDSKPLTGTSTVVGVIAKPLTWWASGLAVGKLGWINSKGKVNGKYVTVPKVTRLAHVAPYLDKIKNYNSEEYLSLLDEAYKAHSENLTTTASAGTDMHSLLEEYVKWCLDNSNGTPMTARVAIKDKRVEEFAKWAQEHVKKFLWSEAHCYNVGLWVGGIIDCGAEMMDGSIAIIDFKSSREAYFNQFCQVGGYNIQVCSHGLFTFDGENIMKPIAKIDKHIIIPFGADKFIAEESPSVERDRESFKAALTLYRGQQDS